MSIIGGLVKYYRLNGYFPWQQEVQCIDNSFPTTTFSIVLYWSEWGWNQSPLVVDNCQQRRWQLPTIWMATANNLNGNCQQSALPSSEGQRDKGQKDGHMPPTSWTATVRAPPPAFDRLCCHGKSPLSLISHLFWKKVAIKFVFVTIALYNGGAWGKLINLRSVE